MNNTDIIIFPQFEKVKTEIEELREKLSLIILERDNLRYVICKNIENKYLLTLGSLEYRAYNKMVEYLRIKRKVELIQKAINHQEEADIDNIETILDDEFTAYKEKLEEMVNDISSAIDWKNGDFLSEEDTKDIKKLYKTIVKKLHPDVNPNITETQKELLLKAITAYEHGDIVTIKIIAELVADKPETSDFDHLSKDMLKEKNRLKSLIGVVKKSIKKIKSEYPYTLKNLLDNEEEIKKKREEFTNLIADYEKMIQFYVDRIFELLDDEDKKNDEGEHDE